MSKLSRRNFLNSLGALSVTGAAPWALNLATIGSAAAQSAPSDYKALVCIFLFGGNDHNNLLIPLDSSSYSNYYNLRSTIAIPSAQILPIQTNNINDGRQFGIHPSLTEIKSLHDNNRIAFISNVGPLIAPTTKADINNKTAVYPPKLYSHNDQQSIWQASAPEGATKGWGGKMGDLLLSNNSNPLFTCVSASGISTLLAGNQVVQYSVGTSGSTPINLITATNLFGSSSAASIARTLMTSPKNHTLEKDYNDVVSRSIDANGTLSLALSGAPGLDLPAPIANYGLAKQLRIIARMMAVNSSLGVKRQVFFASMGGFDTHDNQLNAQTNLFTQISKSMAYFDAALTQIGLQNNVVSFTASDFGRTLASNGDGSDHGWGAHHMVMGPIKGQQLYGTFPTLTINGESDTGSGRLIPTTSVEQYAATLGKWFGLSDTQLLEVLPNLKNFSNKNLGFL